MNEQLESRLISYKFAQATRYLKEESRIVQEGVQALCNMFGDIGWFEGDMELIIQHAIEDIIKR